MSETGAPQRGSIPIKTVAKTDLDALRKLPSVDEVLRSNSVGRAIERFGRPAVVDAVRSALAGARKGGDAAGGAEYFASAALEWLSIKSRPSLRPVFNLTGTVLHTNLGRAVLAEPA